MEIKSVFAEFEELPSKYTKDGEETSPPLEIIGVPDKAKTLALVVDDPDAVSKGVWTHWIIWNIPADTQKMEEGKVPKGAVQGVNDAGKNEYTGPSPPSGTHKYRFKIYALDKKLTISNHSKVEDLERAMREHIIEQALLIGVYSKK